MSDDGTSPGVEWSDKLTSVTGFSRQAESEGCFIVFVLSLLVCSKICFRKFRFFSDNLVHSHCFFCFFCEYFSRTDLLRPSLIFITHVFWSFPAFLRLLIFWWPPSRCLHGVKVAWKTPRNQYTTQGNNISISNFFRKKGTSSSQHRGSQC